MSKSYRVWALCLAVLVAGCAKEDVAAPADVDQPGTSAAHVDTPATDDPAPVADGTAAADDTSPPQAIFDPTTVPSSDIALGDFPFIGLPAGYAPVNRPSDLRFARFPYWLGTGFHWVEGRTWASAIGIERGNRDKTFSALELKRNIDTVIETAGGRQIFEGAAPPRATYYDAPWAAEITGTFHSVVNGLGGSPLSVYVIRQAEREIWVQLGTSSPHASLVITETMPMSATARWTDAFPYLQLPDGYATRRRPEQRDFDRVPFWTGSAIEWIEGRTWHSYISADDRRFSMYELRRELERLVADAGGTRVFDGKVPKEEVDKVDADVLNAYSDGGGFRWQDPIQVYRVPRGETELWIQARADARSGGWVIAERAAFVQSAQLLPASALQKALADTGRVALQVHFATDRAEILPESQPQIAAVVELLQADDALALSIEGHTDNTGDAARNRTLSQARAASVVAAITGAGIAGRRLTSVGHGDTQPVADNTTDDGRAQNRRVELVRRD